MYHVLVEGHRHYILNAEGLEFASDVMEFSDKKYIRIRLHGDVLAFMNRLEAYCETQLENYKPNTFNDEVFVKLPYRYGKYEIDMADCTSEVFRNNEVVRHMQLQVCGVIFIKETPTLSLKLISIKAA